MLLWLLWLPWLLQLPLLLRLLRPHISLPFTPAFMLTSIHLAHTASRLTLWRDLLTFTTSLLSLYTCNNFLCYDDDQLASKCCNFYALYVARWDYSQSHSDDRHVYAIAPCSEDTYSTHHEKESTHPWWHSQSRYRQEEQVGGNSS